MKMDKYRYMILKKKIEEVLSEYPHLKASYIEQKLSHERYRWDLFWAVVPSLPKGMFKDLKDAHIDTALRKIVN